MDVTIVILKFVGLAIAGAIGLLSFFTTKNWEEREVHSAIVIPGRPPKKEPHLTRWGKWSLFFLVLSGLVTLCAQIAETTRTQQKEKTEAKEKQDERERVAKEKEKERERFAKEKEADRKEFDRKLDEQRNQFETSVSDNILLKNDLERQRIHASEMVRKAKLDLKIAIPPDPLLLSPEVTSAFDDAVKAIPEAIKEFAVLRTKEEIERLKASSVSEARAREIEAITRPQLVRIIDWYRSMLAQAQKKGLITLTDLGPAPLLPEQIVFSTKATNNPYGSIAENIAQTVAFAHGDRWHGYLVLGLIDSPEITNSGWFPKFRYKDRVNTVGTIWFDPVVQDFVYESSWRGRSVTSIVAIATNVAEDLKMSRINSLKH